MTNLASPIVDVIALIEDCLVSPRAPMALLMAASSSIGGIRVFQLEAASEQWAIDFLADHRVVGFACKSKGHALKAADVLAQHAYKARWGGQEEFVGQVSGAIAIAEDSKRQQEAVTKLPKPRGHKQTERRKKTVLPGGNS